MRLGLVAAGAEKRPAASLFEMDETSALNEDLDLAGKDYGLWRI
jgi:hypothetical protein